MGGGEIFGGKVRSKEGQFRGSKEPVALAVLEINRRVTRGLIENSVGRVQEGGGPCLYGGETVLILMIDEVSRCTDPPKQGVQARGMAVRGLVVRERTETRKKQK